MQNCIISDCFIVTKMMVSLPELLFWVTCCTCQPLMQLVGARRWEGNSGKGHGIVEREVRSHVQLAHHAHPTKSKWLGQRQLTIVDSCLSQSGEPMPTSVPAYHQNGNLLSLQERLLKLKFDFFLFRMKRRKNGERSWLSQWLTQQETHSAAEKAFIAREAIAHHV